MNTQAREPDFGEESPPSSYSSSQPPAIPRKLGISGTEAIKQLTPDEIVALRQIKRNVDVTKYGGFALGSIGTWVMLSRRKTPLTLVRKLVQSVGGGFGGTLLLVPFGIVMSKKTLNSIDNPQHLRDVLAGAMQENRQTRGRPSGGLLPQPPNGGFEQQQQQQERQQQQSAADWGAANTSGSDGFATSDSSSSVRPGQNSQGDAQPTDEMPPGTGPGSRWAQLRGERGVEPSKWERIRQDSARATHNRNASQSQEKDQVSQSQNQWQQAPSFGRQSGAPRTNEPVMTLSGEGDDPRWSSPQSFSPQSSGWGDSEFIDESGGRGAQQRKYGVLSVIEEEHQKGRLQGFQIESDAPIQVAKGSLLAALVGGVSGAVYGVMKGKQGVGTVFATRMGINFFAFAFPFFAVREYIVSPVLNRSSSGPDPENRHMRLRATPNKHTDKIAASGISGAVAGAGFAAYGKGLQSAPKGALTFGVVCMGLQLAGNEARIARNSVLRPYRPSPAIPAAAALSSQRDVVSSLSSSETVPPTTISPSLEDSKAELVKAKDEKKSTFLSKIESIMPFRKISDEEYETTLDERLQLIHQRIADIEAEILNIEKQENERSAGTGDKI